MFTGLIRHIGTLQSVSRQGTMSLLKISHDFEKHPEQGASIAVQGVCLTVSSLWDTRTFQAECHFATLKKTTLNDLRPGAKVHLEPAMTLSDPLDGHLVQGHVSSVVKIQGIQNIGAGIRMSFELPSPLRNEIVREGSVAVNGVSLTVESLKQNHFAVQLIGETLLSSCLSSLRVGDSVNLETDMLLRSRAAVSLQPDPSQISIKQLSEWGY